MMNIVAFDIGVKNFAMAWVQAQGDAPMIRYMSLIDLSSEKGAWSVYKGLMSHLKSLDWLFEEARPTILIEQQMAAKHRSNIQALRLSQHVLAYFLHRHPGLRVVEYSARIKTRAFSFSGTKYRDRKKWAIEKSRSYMENDPVALDWFEQFRKKDDVADCILMCASFLLHQ